MSKRVLKVAYVLLALMSVASFGGPFFIGSIMRGGASPNWPPDRPVEWVAFAGVTAIVVVVMVGLASIWVVNQKELNAARDRARLARESTPPDRGDA